MEINGKVPAEAGKKIEKDDPFMQAMAKVKPNPNAPHLVRMDFDRLDLNKDGGVTYAEFERSVPPGGDSRLGQALAAAARALVRPLIAMRFMFLDKNDDSRLSFGEYARGRGLRTEGGN